MPAPPPEEREPGRAARVALAVVPPLLFAGLAVVSMRGVLSEKGYVGLSWDWGIPNHSSLFGRYAGFTRHSWQSAENMGSPAPEKLGRFYYQMFLLALSPLGGEAVSKLLPIAGLAGAGWSVHIGCSSRLFYPEHGLHPDGY